MVWECVVARLDSLVGILFLLSTIIGSVLIVTFLVVLSTYGLGRGVVDGLGRSVCCESGNAWSCDV